MNLKITTTAAVAGLCMAVGYQTYQAGNHIIGMIVWIIGVGNLYLLVKMLK